MSGAKCKIIGRIGRIGRICCAAQSRRGSVYILVVSVLSVLVLLTLTLSYISRMDLLASRNWSWAVQQRMAAVTGVPRLQKAAMRPRQTNGPAANVSAQNAPLANGPDQNMMAGNMRNPRFSRNVGLNQNGMGIAGVNRKGVLEPLKLGMELGTSFLGGRAGTSALNAASGRISRAGVDARDPRNAAGADARAPREDAPSLAAWRIEDESAKIDINAVLPDLDNIRAEARTPNQPITGQNRKLAEAVGAVTETELANLIEEVCVAAKLRVADPRTLAHAIALRRYGPDGRPGKAYTDDNANNGYTDALHDRVDNDRDGLVDEPDEALAAATHDGIDNNRDGVVDEPGESIAQDGLDNNRNGRADEPNEAIDDPDEGTADPRGLALGDDAPYTSLEQLMSVPGMTPELYRALSPYLTTFSVGFAAFTLDEQRRTGEAPSGFPQVDPNTATPAQIYQALKRRFPKAGAALLGQFTANLIDRRDLDNLPTSIQVGAATYYGIEINPCINEVCPDPNYGANKDGQFVELYNPWSQAVSLSGWTLRGSGAGAPLAGTLPAGGYMVLTDDINNDNDVTPEDEAAEGSFYNVFHRVGSGPMHQIVEAPGLKLPARNGRLQLVNAEGAVVDEFAYGDGRNRGALKSFQRLDPRLRQAELLAATPLEENAGLKELEGGDEQVKQAFKVMEQWQNQPLRSPLDVMLVATAHTDGETSSALGEAQAALPDSAADLIGEDGGAEAPTERMAARAFLLPALSASEANNLDARLVDCFRVGAVIPEVDELKLALQTIEAPRCMAVFGRVNLNTAPAAVIVALPGMTPAMARKIVLARGGEAALAAAQSPTAASGADDRTWWIPDDPLREGRWANLSDFIRDEILWEGRPLYDRLDAVYAFSQVASWHTLSLRIVTASLPPEPPKKEELAAAGANANGTAQASASVPRRQSTVRAERIIAGDRGCVETVTFSFLGAASERQANPEALHAAGTAGARVSRLNLEAITQQVEQTNQRLAAMGHTPIASVAPVAQRNAAFMPRATPQPTAPRRRLPR